MQFINSTIKRNNTSTTIFLFGNPRLTKTLLACNRWTEFCRKMRKCLKVVEVGDGTGGERVGTKYDIDRK